MNIRTLLISVVIASLGVSGFAQDKKATKKMAKPGAMASHKMAPHKMAAKGTTKMTAKKMTAKKGKKPMMKAMTIKPKSK